VPVRGLQQDSERHDARQRTDAEVLRWLTS
jgi:hypothetical protein